MINDKFPTALPEGIVLAGQFIIEEVLGQGGFGITYKAKDHKTGDIVAIKEYFPDTMVSRTNTTVIPYTGEREENFKYGLDCFLREAETLAKYVDIDGVVSIRSYFEENGTAYFVMDFVDGESFDDYIKEKGGKITYEEAKNVLLPVIDALSFVHKDGIVHRDVTPDNIYITKDGAIKLLDFGAARYSIGDKSRSLDVVLKHGYAPKEQYTRHGKQGPFTDIYTVGVCFYRAITGKLPTDSIDRLDEDDVVLPSTLGVKIEPHEEEAILKAMAIQPADRFASMEEFKAALIGDVSEAVKEDNSAVVSGEKLSTEGKADESKSAENNAESEVKTEKKKKISKPLIIFAVLAAVVLIGFFARPYIIRGIDYIRAERYVANKEYGQAITMYEYLGDTEKAQEIAYIHASNCLNLEADYLDPASREEGVQLTIAVLNFEKAGDYKDSKEKLKEAKFRLGCFYFDDDEYDSAIKYFEELDDYTLEGYASASQMAKACKYMKAYNLLESEDEDDVVEAIEILSELDNYSPSSDYEKACDLVNAYNYDIAVDYLSDGYYEDAIALFEELGTYSDSEDKILSAKYGYVLSNKNDSDEKTREYLDELYDADYSDARGIWTDLYGWVGIYGISLNEISNPSEFNFYTSGVGAEELYCYYYAPNAAEDTFILKVYKDDEQIGTDYEFEVEKEDSISWSGPATWTGTHIAWFRFYDSEGHLLAEASYTVMNEE